MNVVLRSWAAAAIALFLATATPQALALGYTSATIENRTDVRATGTVTYPGCKGETYTVAPNSTWTSPGSRGLCLISGVKMNKAGAPVTHYTSSGTSYSRFVITRTALGHRIWSVDELKGNMPEGSEVAASVLRQPFYNIAHMTNTKASVDWAMSQGVNAVEMDLQFDAAGQPSVFQHRGVCDCTCVPILPPVGHVCTALQPAGDRCNASVGAAEQLQHVAKKGLALVYIDNKIDGKAPAAQGANLVRFLLEHLFKNGHQGIVVIGGTSETTAFLNAAAAEARSSAHVDQIYFAMDEFGTDSKVGTAGLIDKLVKDVDSKNRLYGTGLTSCSPTQYFRESSIGVKQQTAGVVSATYIWTVDSEDSMIRYINLGVRGVMTNKPAALRDLLSRYEVALAPVTYRPPRATVGNANAAAVAAAALSITQAAPPAPTRQSNGAPWVVNREGNIFRGDGRNWQQIAGGANDIGVGADGSVWVIGTHAVPGGFGILRMAGSSWTQVDGGAVRITVDKSGEPWVVNSEGRIFHRSGSAWRELPGRAMDIGAGGNGEVWVIGTDPSPGGFGIYRWNGSDWTRTDGAALRIAVGPDGNPWVVNSDGRIYRRQANGWVEMPGRAKDIAVSSATGTPWVIGTDASPGGNGIYFWTGSTWERIEGGAVGIAAR